MKHVRVIILSAICLSGLIFNAFAGKPDPAGKGFVVVELFTSEGCSSCPPADELVAKVQKQYQNEPVYILAYHVDYWNRLGWKDVFSDAAYSQRQEAYAKTLHIPSVYTPQIVVNGQKEFVGSQEGNLRNSIINGLGKSSSAQINLTALKNTGSKIAVTYTVSAAPKYSEVVLALVQKSAQTKVKSGENGGHTLSHVQIVRQLQRQALGSNATGAGTLTLPSISGNQNFEVIVLLQDLSNGQITAATKQAIPAAL